MPKKKKNSQKFSEKFLDKMFELGYNESIKNEAGGSPIRVDKIKRGEFKKVLDKEFNLEYNEVIKNGIGN